MATREETCGLEVREKDGRTELVLRGRLDAAGAGPIWNSALAAARKAGESVVQASGVDYCDGSGVALLLDLRRAGVKRIDGLRPEFQNLLDRFDVDAIPKSFTARRTIESFPGYIGEQAMVLFRDVRALIEFTGQMAVLLPLAFLHPSKVRWKDTWPIFEKVGNHALLIVCLIGFLMGLIMGFQSAMPLRQFGVDIFVVNLVTLAMLRELGPIMTAIVLAGRSGSAFAAEIGTMKVNEEVDALTTMGLDPGRFLVVPRVLAAMLAAPLLSIYANLMGILGGVVVVASLGYPWATIFNQLTNAISTSDIMAGLIKSVVFGLLVGGVGCLRGLQTGRGALSVGASTTRAVVSAIILIVLADAVFAVLFYSIDF